MLKGFWLNFVLTVAVCMGGLCSLNAIADLVEVEENAPPVYICWGCNPACTGALPCGGNSGKVCQPGGSACSTRCICGPKTGLNGIQYCSCQ